MTRTDFSRLVVLHKTTVPAFCAFPFPKRTNVVVGGSLAIHTVHCVGQRTASLDDGRQHLAENSAQKQSQLGVSRFFVKSGEIRLEDPGLDFHAIEQLVALRLCHQNALRHAIGGGELSQSHVFDQGCPDYSARADDKLWVVFMDRERDLSPEKSIADMLSRRYGAKSNGGAQNPEKISRVRARRD